MLLASAVLTGCPQLLDDQFDDDPVGDASVGSHAPLVLGSRPAAGEAGVASDTSIQLTFSDPMDAAATEAAYRSADLPADSVDFSWSADGRVLLIDPRDALAYASGTDPASVLAHRYSIELSGARDATGRPLEPFSLSFSTAREIEASLPIVSDATLSGKLRSDGTIGVGECENSQQTVCAGSGATTGNPSIRGFATFDLAALPAARLALTRADLTLTISVVYGTPFTSLGPLLLESVRFDSVDLPAFDAPPRGPTLTLATDASVDDTPSLDVLSAVQADAAEGTRSQFRLRFTESVSAEGGPDLFASNWPTLQLRVGYLLP